MTPGPVSPAFQPTPSTPPTQSSPTPVEHSRNSKGWFLTPTRQFTSPTAPTTGRHFEPSPITPSLPEQPPEVDRLEQEPEDFWSSTAHSPSPPPTAAPPQKSHGISRHPLPRIAVYERPLPVYKIRSRRQAGVRWPCKATAVDVDGGWFRTLCGMRHEVICEVSVERGRCGGVKMKCGSTCNDFASN